MAPWQHYTQQPRRQGTEMASSQLRATAAAPYPPIGGKPPSSARPSFAQEAGIRSSSCLQPLQLTVASKQKPATVGPGFCLVADPGLIATLPLP